MVTLGLCNKCSSDFGMSVSVTLVSLQWTICFDQEGYGCVRYAIYAAMPELLDGSH